MSVATEINTLKHLHEKSTTQKPLRIRKRGKKTTRDSKDREKVEIKKLEAIGTKDGEKQKRRNLDEKGKRRWLEKIIN